MLGVALVLVVIAITVAKAAKAVRWFWLRQHPVRFVEQLDEQ
jgi:hypothetical protein